jgi:hypothetical protein
MKEITAALLLAIAKQANIPDSMAYPNEFGDHIFDGPNGWKVIVFYDAGELDYIDRFVSPSGTTIEIVDNRDVKWLDDPAWLNLQNFRGDV